MPQAMREQVGNAGGDAVEGEESSARRKPSKDIRVDEVRATNEFATTTAARGE